MKLAEVMESAMGPVLVGECRGALVQHGATVDKASGRARQTVSLIVNIEKAKGTECRQYSVRVYLPDGAKPDLPAGLERGRQVACVLSQFSPRDGKISANEVHVID